MTPDAHDWATVRRHGLSIRPLGRLPAPARPDRRRGARRPVGRPGRGRRHRGCPDAPPAPRHAGADGGLRDRLRGLDELRRRLAKERKEALSRYRLDDVLGDIREELTAIVATERRGIERRMVGGGPDGRTMTRGWSAWPPIWPPVDSSGSTRCRTTSGERIRALGEYDFLEPEARDRYQALRGAAAGTGARRRLPGHVRCHPGRDPGAARREPGDGA